MTYAARDIIVGLGESYMSGPAGGVVAVDAPPAGYPPGDGSLFMFSGTTGWAELTEPCSITNGSIGPLGFMGWLAAQDLGREVGVINTGVGGSRSDQWLPGQTNYTNALQRILSATARPNATLRAIVVAQGLNDAAVGSTSYWLSRWLVILNHLKMALGPRAYNVPTIVIKTQSTVPTDTTYNALSAVIADQVAWGALDPANNLLVESVEGDYGWREASKVHCKTAGFYELGVRSFNAWASHASYPG